MEESYTITGTFTVGEVTTFATKKGWVPTIPDPNNEGQTIDNPQSATEYLANCYKQMIGNDVVATAEEIANDTAKAQQDALTEQAVAAIDAAKKAAVENARQRVQEVLQVTVN